MKTSKADRVRLFLHLNNSEAAERAGVTETYVRTVRQRTSTNGFPKYAPGELGWVRSERRLLSSREYSQKRARRMREAHP